MKAMTSIVAFIALLTCGCAPEAERTTNEQLTDQALQQMVNTRLQSDANIRRLNLEVAADAQHHAVELRGVAYTQRQRTRAVELARSTGADVVVEDKIDVKPYEIPRDLFDEEMMTDVRADASKMGDKVGDSLDDGWLHMKVVAKLIADTQTPERTINVDVTDGVVTLRGSVPTNESRAQAESVAKSVDGVMDVKNRLVVKG